MAIKFAVDTPKGVILAYLRICSTKAFNIPFFDPQNWPNLEATNGIAIS